MSDSDRSAEPTAESAAVESSAVGRPRVDERPDQVVVTLQPVLRLSGVGKRYGRGDWVLRDIDLELHAGEVLAVAAANGAGKSTLLRLIVGACRASAGTVGPRPAATRYVPDRVAMNDRMPALGYLIHMGRIQGMPTAGARRRAVDLLDRLEFVGGHQTPIRKLSKGNAQKVALAQAVLTRPSLLVLDEPWTSLDAGAHAAASAIICEVAESGGAVVFADHQESIVLTNAAVQLYLAGGRLTDRRYPYAGPASAEVVLFSDPNRPPTDTPNWQQTAGVLDIRAGSPVGEPTVLRIRVSPDRVDAVLLLALSHSWSVARVEREVGPTWSR